MNRERAETTMAVDLQAVDLNKKRGIKDERQLFNTGEFEKVGNDTRNVYNSRFDTIFKWYRSYAYIVTCDTHRFFYRNDSDTVSCFDRFILGVSST